MFPYVIPLKRLKKRIKRLQSYINIELHVIVHGMLVLVPYSVHSFDYPDRCVQSSVKHWDSWHLCYLCMGSSCWARVGRHLALFCAESFGPTLTQAEPRVGSGSSGADASLTFEWEAKHLLY